MPRAGLEPATCRLGVDNGTSSARSRGCHRGRGAQPAPRRDSADGDRTRLHQITGRSGPRREIEQARQDSHPDPRGWSSRCSCYTTSLWSGRPGSNGPLRRGAPVLFRLSYIRVRHARLGSNQRPLASQTSALSAELRACVSKPPAGVEPAPRPYKGRVLAVDTKEACSAGAPGDAGACHWTNPTLRRSTCSKPDSPAKSVASVAACPDASAPWRASHSAASSAEKAANSICEAQRPGRDTAG